MDGIISFLDLLAKVFPQLKVCGRCAWLLGAPAARSSAAGRLTACLRFAVVFPTCTPPDCLPQAHRMRCSVQDGAEFGRIGRYYAVESMLLWDPQTQQYVAEATPSYGKDTLEEFFNKAIKEGLKGQELGDQVGPAKPGRASTAGGGAGG